MSSRKTLDGRLCIPEGRLTRFTRLLARVVCVRDGKVNKSLGEPKGLTSLGTLVGK